MDISLTDWAYQLRSDLPVRAQYICNSWHAIRPSFSEPVTKLNKLPAGGTASIFDQLEDCDFDVAVAKCGELAAANTWAVVGGFQSNMSSPFLFDTFLTHDWGEDELGRDNHQRVLLSIRWWV